MNKERILKIVFPNFVVSLVLILACIFWGYLSHLIARGLVTTTEVECSVLREGDDFTADCNGVKKSLIKDRETLLAYIDSKKITCYIPVNNKNIWCK